MSAKTAMPKIPKRLLAAIERHKKAIGEHRDALRELIEDVEAVIDSSDRGVEYLESAVDALSEYV